MRKLYVALLCMFCIGCSSAPPRHLLLVWYDESTRTTRFSDVTIITSDAPFIDCPRLAIEYKLNPVVMLIGTPLACTLYGPERAIVVLPHNPSITVVQHELCHVTMGAWHPDFLPHWGTC